jgi:hypothetical protein
MQTTSIEALHSLQQGESLRIHGGVGETVIVFGGEVWLTQDGDLRDIFLGAGESFTLDVSAPALLHAVKPAQLMLAGPALAAARQGVAARVLDRALAALARLIGARHPHIERWPAPRPALA